MSQNSNINALTIRLFSIVRTCTPNNHLHLINIQVGYGLKMHLTSVMLLLHLSSKYVIQGYLPVFTELQNMAFLLLVYHSPFLLSAHKVIHL